MDLNATEKKMLEYQLPCELNYTITSVSREINKRTKWRKPELNPLFEIMFDTQLRRTCVCVWYVKNNLPQTMPRNTLQYWVFIRYGYA